MDLLGYEEGYCEVCEKVVEERELQQCQLGFCRTFLCTSCAQHCSSCKNGNDADSLFMAFCSPCSNKVAPKCFNCKNRLCGRCTSFTKVCEFLLAFDYAQCLLLNRVNQPSKSICQLRLISDHVVSVSMLLCWFSLDEAKTQHQALCHFRRIAHLN